MSAKVKALLLAAGIGTRLRPLTDVLPKCLMPIDGRALLGCWFDLLTEAGITDMLVNLHHHADLVRDYVARSRHAPHVTLAFEDSLLGTGGTLLRHKERFAGGPVMLVHADNLSLFSVQRFLEAHRQRPAGCAITMMTFTTDAPEQSGIVELDAAGRVVQLYEKKKNSPGNLANGAVYLMEPEVLSFIESLNKPFVDISTEVLPRYVGRIFAFYNEVYHRDIGSPASLAQAQLEYPLVAARHGAPAGTDPLIDMMSADGGALGLSFRRAVHSTYADPAAGLSILSEPAP